MGITGEVSEIALNRSTGAIEVPPPEAVLGSRHPPEKREAPSGPLLVVVGYSR
jgi:hypothetical protein